MERKQHTVFALLLALGTTVPAVAQDPPSWNREIAAVSWTETSGGLFDLRVHVRGDANNLTAPIDLSTGVDISLNGTVVSSQVLSATAEPGEEQFWIGVGQVDVPLTPHDEIMVILYPSPGAVPEPDSSGDFEMHVADGGPRFWNRRIDSVTLRPSITEAGDQFFDIWINPEFEARYGGSLDLAAEIVVLSDGVPVGTFPVDDFTLPIIVDGCNVSCDPLPCYTVGTGGPDAGQCELDVVENWCRCVGDGGPSNIGTVEIPGVPGVQLVPVPGALPELPGFEEDDEALPCLGDVTGDGFINVTDLLALLAAWGDCPGDCPPACLGDFNGDCNVGVIDLLTMLGGWGPCGGPV